MKQDILFSEVQSFRRSWVMITILIVTVAAVLIQTWQFLSGSDRDSGNQADLITVICIISIINVFLLSIRLETQIKKEGISVRFFPFTRGFRNFSWDTIAQVQVRKYQPLIEYGGWGLRFGNGLAYNISGNTGIQLIFKDGSKLLIGTQRPDEAAEALQRLMNL